MNEAHGVVTSAGLEEQLGAATQAAHEAQAEHQRIALANVEGRATQKELDKATEALHKANVRIATLRSAIVAAEQREKKEAEEAAAAKVAAEKAAIAEKLQALSAVASEFDAELDRIVEVAKAFDAASRAVYALGPTADIVQGCERARQAATEILLTRLAPLTGRPRIIQPNYSMRLVDHTVPAEAAKAAHHK